MTPLTGEEVRDMWDDSDYPAHAWPSNGVPFNRWYRDLPRFIQVLSEFDWCSGEGASRFKYVNIRVDTRNGNFVISDRDGSTASPDDIAKHVSSPGEQDGR